MAMIYDSYGDNVASFGGGSYGDHSYAYGDDDFDFGRDVRDVRFTNDLDTSCVVAWRGEPYGTLDAGEAVTVETYPGHEWSVYDDHTGKPVTQFAINDRRSNYRFSRYAGRARGISRPKRRSRRKAVKRIAAAAAHTAEKDMSYRSVPWINQSRGPCIHHIHEAVKVGHRQQTNAGIPIETRSTHPRIFMVRNFLSDAECDHIVNQASRRGFQRSTVVGGDGAGGRFSRTRTSSTAWLGHYDTNTLADVFRRAAALLHIDESAMHRVAEDLQVVHYSAGQKNSEHYDTLQLGHHGDDRLLTLLFYLKHPHEYSGGATRFSHNGIEVKGNKGDAVLFYSMLPDGNLDEKSLHAGTPVTRGEKCIANLWIWDTQRVN